MRQSLGVSLEWARPPGLQGLGRRPIEGQEPLACWDPPHHHPVERPSVACGCVHRKYAARYNLVKSNVVARIEHQLDRIIAEFTTICSYQTRDEVLSFSCRDVRLKVSDTVRK